MHFVNPQGNHMLERERDDGGSFALPHFGCARSERESGRKEEWEWSVLVDERLPRGRGYCTETGVSAAACCSVRRSR